MGRSSFAGDCGGITFGIMIMGWLWHNDHGIMMGIVVILILRMILWDYEILLASSQHSQIVTNSHMETCSDCGSMEL